jgi:hypothetical protein
VGHTTGEAPLEEPGRAREDQARHPRRLGQGEGQGHVAAQRIATDHRARDLEGVEEGAHEAHQLADGRLTQRGIENRERGRDGAADVAQDLEHALPVVHAPHQAVQQQHGLALASLQPLELAVAGVAHGFRFLPRAPRAEICQLVDRTAGITSTSGRMWRRRYPSVRKRSRLRNWMRR